MHNRYLVQISHPRVVDRKMLVALCIREWSEDLCFYYPVDLIDNRHLLAHVLWKLTSDSEYTVNAMVEADLSQKDYEYLNLHNWDFSLH